MDWEYFNDVNWGSMNASDWQTLQWVSPIHESLSASMQVVNPFRFGVIIETAMNAGFELERGGSACQ